MYALDCENGLHVVDLETTKKLKFFKTFQNSINFFFQTHNVILSHFKLISMHLDPIYGKNMG